MINNHSFNTIDVTDGTQMELYVAIPEGDGPFPAIMLFQEAFGVNSHIRNMVEKFCNEGYMVVSPDLFHRTIKRLEAPYNDFSLVTPHFQAITIQNLEADLKACYNFLQNQPKVEKTKIGCIGYCLGGRVSFIANSILPLSAAVSYYGGGIDQLTHLAKDLHAPHVFFWGGFDAHITKEKIAITITAVREAGKQYTNIVIPDAEHAFNNDERPSYNESAANEAWVLTRSFFETYLKS